MEMKRYWKKHFKLFQISKKNLMDVSIILKSAMHVIAEPLWNRFLQLKEKGVRLRTVTEVTHDNISYVNKLMEVSEVRHLTGVRSNFGID